MKRKILLTLSIAVLLVCLFAIAVNAEIVVADKNKDSNGDIIADLLIDLGDNYHISSVDISYTANDGATKTGKLYYETSLWTGKNYRQVKTVYIPKDFDFTQVICFLDKVDIDGNKAYASNELIKLYQGGGGFQMLTYASYENGEFTGTENAKPYVEAVSYSKYFEKFADKGFGTKDVPNLKTVTYNGKEAVPYTFFVSSKINEIFSGSFGGEGSNTNANTFNPLFTRLVFEDRTGTVEMKQYCFTRGTLEEVVFGTGTYTLSGKEGIALQFNGIGTSETSLKRIIVSKDTKMSGTISWGVGTYQVIFVGTQDEYDSVYSTNCSSALSGNTSEVVCNPCYFSGHSEMQDDGDCTTAVVCANGCGKIYKEAMSHNANKRVSYENFFETGYYYEGCTNDGCQVGEKTDAEPIFKSMGYSCATYGDTYAVIQSFCVNVEALEAYGKYVDGISFGVVAAVGSQDPLSLVNGEAETNVIKVALGSINENGKLDTAYKYFDIKVTNIAVSRADTDIVFCAYLAMGEGDDATYVYLNGGETSSKASGISYNEVLKVEQNAN